MDHEKWYIQEQQEETLAPILQILEEMRLHHSLIIRGFRRGIIGDSDLRVKLAEALEDAAKRIRQAYCVELEEF